MDDESVMCGRSVDQMIVIDKVNVRNVTFFDAFDLWQFV